MNSSLFKKPGLNPLWQLIVLMAAVLLTACNTEETTSTGQSIAKVNGSPLTAHQFNSLLNQASANTREPVDPQEIAKKFIDQELAIQETLRLKLDRRPEILEKLELARREVLAGAYADFLSKNIKKASFVEIQKYYQSHPELFAKRKIYQLRVFRLPLILRENADFVATLKDSPNLDTLVQWLTKEDVSFVVADELRSAEQLPISALKQLSLAEKDKLVIFDTGRDITIYSVLNSIEAGFNPDQASARIETFLNTNRVREQVNSGIEELKKQSQIELYGEFANLLKTTNER